MPGFSWLTQKSWPMNPHCYFLPLVSSEANSWCRSSSDGLSGDKRGLHWLAHKQRLAQIKTNFLITLEVVYLKAHLPWKHLVPKELMNAVQGASIYITVASSIFSDKTASDWLKSYWTNITLKPVSAAKSSVDNTWWIAHYVLLMLQLWELPCALGHSPIETFHLGCRNVPSEAWNKQRASWCSFTDAVHCIVKVGYSISLQKSLFSWRWNWLVIQQCVPVTLTLDSCVLLQLPQALTAIMMPNGCMTICSLEEIIINWWDRWLITLKLLKCSLDWNLLS